LNARSKSPQVTLDLLFETIPSEPINEYGSYNLILDHQSLSVIRSDAARRVKKIDTVLINIHSKYRGRDKKYCFKRPALRSFSYDSLNIKEGCFTRLIRSLETGNYSFQWYYLIKESAEG
jgi:hypothetical protein